MSVKDTPVTLLNKEPTSHISADVQSVQYNTTDVYVRRTTAPSHNVGPFPGNPNTPENTNSIFRITRSPRKATSNTRTGLGPIGVFVNGVPAFNALDGRSYFNQGTWNQNAYVTEGRTFDAALGPPAPGRGGAEQMGDLPRFLKSLPGRPIPAELLTPLAK